MIEFTFIIILKVTAKIKLPVSLGLVVLHMDRTVLFYYSSCSWTYFGKKKVVGKAMETLRNQRASIEQAAESTLLFFRV